MGSARSPSPQNPHRSPPHAVLIRLPSWSSGGGNPLEVAVTFARYELNQRAFRSRQNYAGCVPFVLPTASASLVFCRIPFKPNLRRTLSDLVRAWMVPLPIRVAFGAIEKLLIPCARAFVKSDHSAYLSRRMIDWKLSPARSRDKYWAESATTGGAHGVGC